MPQTELEMLVFQMDVNLTKMNKKLAQVLGNVSDTTKKMRKSLDDGGKGLGDGLGNSIKLNRNQLMELQHVARASFDSLASGASPMRVLTQQGAQLAQALGSGKGGVAGGLAALGSAAGEFAPIILAVTALAAVVGTFGLGLHAAAVEAEDLRNAASYLDLMGNGAKYSAKSVADLSAGIRSTGVSAKDANTELRDFIKNNVAPDRLEQFATAARELAKVLGEDVPTAAKQISSGFTGTYADMMKVSEISDALTTKEKAYIKSLYDQGDASRARSEAFRIFSEKVAKAYNESLSEMDRLQSAVAGSWAALTSALGNTSAFESASKAIDGLLGSLTNWLRQYEAVKALSDSDLKAEQQRLSERLTGPNSAANYKREAAQNVVKSAAIRAVTGVYVAPKDADQLRKADEQRLADIANQRLALQSPTGDTAFRAHVDKATHTPGLSPEALSASVTQIADSADRARAQALAAIQDDILSKAQAEKAAIDAELSQTLDAIATKKNQVESDKKLGQSKKDELTAQLATAADTQKQAADIRKRTVDAEAQIKLDAQSLDLKKKIVGYQIDELRAQESLTSDPQKRAQIEHQILDLQKSISDRQIANDQHAKELRANAASTDGTPVIVASSGQAQAANDAAYQAQGREIDLQANALLRWAANIKTLNETMQEAAIDGLQSLNQGIADLVINGGKASDVIRNVLNRVLEDLITGQLQNAEKGFAQTGTNIINAIFGHADGRIPGYANGRTGMIVSGPGTGRSDSILAMGNRGFLRVSDGEAIINAASTKKYGSLLKAINDGTLPAYAYGRTPSIPAGVLARSQASTAPAQAPYFDLRGAVLTQDLLNQMNQIGQRSATAGARMATAQVQRNFGQIQRTFAKYKG